MSCKENLESNTLSGFEETDNASNRVVWILGEVRNDYSRMVQCRFIEVGNRQMLRCLLAVRLQPEYVSGIA